MRNNKLTTCLKNTLQNFLENQCSYDCLLLQVGPKTTPEMTQCLCTHLTDFGGDVMVAPNPIDMGAVFAGLKNLGDNLGVLMVILTIFLVYTILCVWSKKKDRQDDIDVCIQPYLNLI